MEYHYPSEYSTQDLNTTFGDVDLVCS